MGKPKIFVLHMRQIIVTCIFAFLGFLLLLLAVYFFAPTAEETAQPTPGVYLDDMGFYPGTYRAKIALSYRPVFVEVTVDETDILAVSLLPLTHNQEILYPLLSPTMEHLAPGIVYNQAIDFYADHEHSATSAALLLAVYDAINQARTGQPSPETLELIAQFEHEAAHTAGMNTLEIPEADSDTDEASTDTTTDTTYSSEHTTDYDHSYESDQQVIYT